VSRGMLEYLLNKLYNPRNRKGLLAYIGSEDAVVQVEHTRQTGEQFFNSILAWIARQPRPTGRPGAWSGDRAPAQNTIRVQAPNIVANVLSEELKKLATQIDATAKDLDDEQKIEFLALSNRCWQLQLSLEQWLGQKLDGNVYWIEATARDGRPQRIDLI